MTITVQLLHVLLKYLTVAAPLADFRQRDYDRRGFPETTTSNHMRRIWILPIAATLITAACLYKYTRTYDPAQFHLPEQRCPAAQFEFPAMLAGQLNSQPVKLQSLIGRHRVLIVFYDGEAGAEADPFLVRLRHDYEQLQRANIKVLGISTAVPSQNRPPKPGIPVRLPNQPKEPFPFQLLTDFPPACIAHKRWGRYDYDAQKPLTGVFAIDEVGTVLCDGDLPKPLESPDSLLAQWIQKD